jgi:hypothetical protein
MQIGSANSDGFYSHLNLAGPGIGNRRSIRNTKLMGVG